MTTLEFIKNNQYDETTRGIYSSNYCKQIFSLKDTSSLGNETWQKFQTASESGTSAVALKFFF